MVQDRLTKAVLRRFKELGLPPSLMDLGQFREHFFSHGWLMYVRDGDEVADVHLVEQNPASAKPLSWKGRESRKAQRRR